MRKEDDMTERGERGGGLTLRKKRCRVKSNAKNTKTQIPGTTSKALTHSDIPKKGLLYLFVIGDNILLDMVMSPVVGQS